MPILEENRMGFEEKIEEAREGYTKARLGGAKQFENEPRVYSILGHPLV